MGEGWSCRGLIVGCVTPVGSPQLQLGMGTGERQPRDGGQGRGAEEIPEIGDGDRVGLLAGDVPIAILTPYPCVMVRIALPLPTFPQCGFHADERFDRAPV